tara:strand:- start:145 stop:387 length:243 start_codon:yes stop_codon:yes gene_type:complete
VHYESILPIHFALAITIFSGWKLWIDASSELPASVCVVPASGCTAIGLQDRQDIAIKDKAVYFFIRFSLSVGGKWVVGVK